MTLHGWEMFISVVYLLSSRIRWMVMMFCPLQEFALAHHDTWVRFGSVFAASTFAAMRVSHI